MVYLAISAWDDSRANAERVRSEQNPRYMISTLERPDENTGADEEETGVPLLASPVAARRTQTDDGL